MANAVFIQNPKSIYKDRPGVWYHFPRRYLRMVEECVDDWIIFYEGQQGARGYVAVQKVSSVTNDPETEGHYYAWLEPGTLWQFERTVPRNDPMGIAYEETLRSEDGRAITGGASVSAVRRISFDEFTRIVSAGLKPLEGPDALPREASTMDHAFAEEQIGFDHAPVMDIRDKILASRLARDQSFARMVKAAYRGKCAISGLDLRNGNGRSEVQAAHIRPVKDDGPDIIINGLELSGTLHWMFDRGLISVGDDYEILVSDNKVPSDVRKKLISPTGKLSLPDDPRHHPHPDYIRYHRENIYGLAS